MEVTVDDVKNALVNYGSISVAIKSSPYVSLFNVLYPPNVVSVSKGTDIPQAVNECPYKGTDMDHGVTIVGWTPCTVS